MSVSANTHVRFIQKCLKASSIQVKAKLGLTYIAVVEFLSEVLFFCVYGPRLCKRSVREPWGRHLDVRGPFKIILKPLMMDGIFSPPYRPFLEGKTA